MESQIRPLFYMLTGIGALLMVIAVIVFFKMRRSPVGNALMAMGRVVDLEEYESEGITYTPVVEFTAHDGTEVRFTDAISSDPPLFKVGQQVKVRYDSANFHNARITGTFRAHMVSIVLLLLGGTLVTIGLVASSD